MKITFLGAAGNVTGSKYLISHNNKNILVDCGLFQGNKDVRILNWSKLQIDPKNIDAVILTHAHIDHSGYIPLLVKNGFRGKIFCSEATFDLCKILLPDSGYLNEEDARNANKYNYSKHKPALPLYTQNDALESLGFFETLSFEKEHLFDKDFSFILSQAGHILGASCVNIFYDNKNILFSGDLGRPNDPIMKDPTVMHYADYLLIESTYGNRLHEKIDPEEVLKEVINKTAANGGKVIIPAFAVGRAQSIMYHLYRLKEKNAIPNIPIFLDSPMAIDASDLLIKYANEHRLSKELSSKICKVAKYVRTAEESKTLNENKVPMIIISASGMAEGGRILHHLKYNISEYQNTILFTGFQVEGTRGEKILSGVPETKIHGINYPIRANIVNLGSMSAHSDYSEILSWLKNFKQPPKKTFITHGSQKSAAALKEKIIQELGWNVTIAEYLKSEEL